ncbi:MAG TPA: helix-turn-helix domain-containing protein [Longimicrobium sp.]|jgi:HTH-type transcriptional regulator/antitoxin HigA|uniref:helix-turn-helix domain-containing protein n=1 Tax=Longimicrobium sp. TaxID=2029185 RepID=UPI002EDAF8AE
MSESPGPHVLRTPVEYDTAVAEIDRLLDLDPAPFSAESDRLELLSVLVEDYEARHDPIDDSDLTPADLVQFMAEQRGMNRAELAEIMGGRSRLSDFMSGKRDLSKGQIQALRDKLGIPADLLL